MYKNKRFKGKCLFNFVLQTFTTGKYIKERSIRKEHLIQRELYCINCRLVKINCNRTPDKFTLYWSSKKTEPFKFCCTHSNSHTLSCRWSTDWATNVILRFTMQTSQVYPSASCIWFDVYYKAVKFNYTDLWKNFVDIFHILQKMHIQKVFTVAQPSAKSLNATKLSCGIWYN